MVFPLSIYYFTALYLYLASCYIATFSSSTFEPCWKLSSKIRDALSLLFPHNLFKGLLRHCNPFSFSKIWAKLAVSGKQDLGKLCSSGWGSPIYAGINLISTCSQPHTHSHKPPILPFLQSASVLCRCNPALFGNNPLRPTMEKVWFR